MRHLTISLLCCLALAGLGQAAAFAAAAPCSPAAERARTAPRARGWSVATLNGAPGLYRDGKPVAPVLFWQWEIEERDAKAMSHGRRPVRLSDGGFPDRRLPLGLTDATP